MCDCVSMAAKRTNTSFDGCWFTVKRKSLKKSSVGLDCKANGGDEVTEESVPAVHAEQSTTLELVNA